MKPENYSVWYQFSFVDDQITRLRKDFLTYFTSKLDDPKEIEKMRPREARLKEIVYDADTDSMDDSDSAVKESRRRTHTVATLH